MLSSHLGVKTFLLGVSLYLKAHAYGNATTEDLWTKLSEAAGVNVSAFMVGPRSPQGFLYYMYMLLIPQQEQLDQGHRIPRPHSLRRAGSGYRPPVPLPQHWRRQARGRPNYLVDSFDVD